MPIARVLADRAKRLVSRDVADDGHDPVGEMHLAHELERSFVGEIPALPAGPVRLGDELTERRIVRAVVAPEARVPRVQSLDDKLTAISVDHLAVARVERDT